MFLSTFLYLQGAISLTYCFLFLVASFILYSEMEVMGDAPSWTRRSPLSWTGWRLRGKCSYCGPRNR